MGSVVMDFFLATNLSEKRKKLPLPVGEKVLVSDFRISLGGGGWNSAKCFSKLKMKTALISSVGSDIEHIFKKNLPTSVDFLGQYSNEISGHSIIIDSTQKNRTILTYKGTNLNLKKFKKRKTSWFYFSTMLGSSFQTQLKIANFAQKIHANIAYNPSSFIPKKDLKKLLPFVHTLFLNKEEATAIFGQNPFKKISKLGPKIICITDGENGSEVFDGKTIFSIRPHKTNFIERTGAGDAYASTFLTYFYRTGNVQEAMKYATLQSYNVIQKFGASVGLKTPEELQKQLKKINLTIKKIK